MKIFFSFIAILLPACSCFASPTDLTAGMIIRTSVTINPKTYNLDANTDNRQPLILIQGHDIVVDFNHALLQGSNHTQRPNEFFGIAIQVAKGSSNVTILNAEVHGYKIAILAEDVKGITIANTDLSYNYRQHLQSNLFREDVSDWMSYHKNENDEWKRYGAAIYLKDCKNAVIRDNLVTGGQCALMMTGCTGAEVTDNNFSFNSGIGIGLYRSSNNTISHNRLDYNVRGFSDGRYKRGQDSAAILVFEQSSHNIFTFNSATHSGDGFFLWAGQHTMDTGEGGSNDNFIYGNDFSFAPTNGVEITFSSNLVMKNIIKECDHGIWGGYSYDTDITDNTFEKNRIGIAIEHGQNINMVLNSFTGDQTGVKLWSREKQPADWIYAQKRNTQSRNYWIAANKFTAVDKAFDIMGTDTVVFSGNTKLLVNEPLVLGDRVDNIDTSRETEVLDMDYQKDERLKKIKATELPASVYPKEKKEMRITEWGPYDFRYPIVWLKDVDTKGIYQFEILGPKGTWTIENTNGFTILEKGETVFPSYIKAKVDSSVMDRKITLRFSGAAYRDAFGKKQDSSTVQDFSYNEWDMLTRWQVSWYRWNGDTDPEKGFESFTKSFAQPAFFSSQPQKIDYTWWGSIEKGLPADSFATVALTKIDIPAGTYRLGITADDYAKVFVDDKEVIDAWNSEYVELDENTYHGTTLTLSKGEHRIRIVHAEKTGLATLQFYFSPEYPKLPQP